MFPTDDGRKVATVIVSCIGDHFKVGITFFSTVDQHRVDTLKQFGVFSFDQIPKDTQDQGDGDHALLPINELIGMDGSTFNTIIRHNKHPHEMNGHLPLDHGLSQHGHDRRKTDHEAVLSTVSAPRHIHVENERGYSGHAPFWKISDMVRT